MSNTERHYSPADQLMMQIDNGLRTMFGKPLVTERPNPQDSVTVEHKLSATEKIFSARLMRINHAGEVAAQGLYQGQALTAKLPNVRDKMQRAAEEENDHLAWCERRIKELGSHTSYFNPLWYFGSVSIGALAGIAGDKWSLGFVAETERQVVQHLDEHLSTMSENDIESRAVLEQMKIDEGRHATVALEAGGAELPVAVKSLMALTSKVMTKTAFWF
ncbi:2-polyprenyl-3-methyl-6-methoxy-1,4-benzoquinol hydroxylase, coq7 type [hydrothermal vent metagenome]|uniref:2-polyprenyl-3-methyl-6-methoxy-1,4-benzoquinol hydroxylase, coq7 type n=1 Tax=hydrothermal vent metagenome TaxID=652676 RepID=A0A3B1A018_9ZZZZ